MNDGLAALFWGVLTFSILILVHEGGHFLAARAFGVKVHEFMMGLPGPALRFRGKKTTYGVTLVPLGGYVRIAGMEPGPEDPRLAQALAAATRLGSANAFDIAVETGFTEADSEALLITLADWDAVSPDEEDETRYRANLEPSDASDPEILLATARSRTYRSLSTPKRLVLLSSGVVANLLVAVLVFTVVLSVFGFYRETMKVDSVGKGSAAAAAGIRPGDRILAIDGIPTRYWARLVVEVQTHEPGDSVTVRISRGTETIDVRAVLGRNPETGDSVLGVTEAYETVPPGRPAAAFLESFSYIALVFSVIGGLFSPTTFGATVSQSSSVIGASYMAADAARAGAFSYAGLIAMLSVSLGVINIFPIPPLDGGKMLLEVIERVRGRELPRRFSLGLSLTGALVLFSLIGYLMKTDVERFILK